VSADGIDPSRPQQPGDLLAEVFIQVVLQARSGRRAGC
jgi:hypothetical protein